MKVGDRLGVFEVTGELGAGGMGVVYRGRDTRLDRDVALKVLPEAFTADPERLSRFEREAKVLASLNHPNIAQIYGVEEAEPSTGSGQGGVRALVLELVAGADLADRIQAGPMPVDEVVAIAAQIADALETAHDAGVIHRDLKPANVKIRDDGTVKVLDFGLAKAFDQVPAETAAGLSASPTVSLTAAATQLGMVLGTAAYMAPEQAKGKAVDKRADIWAFGAVFYEMLTGRRAFAGDDVADTLAHVLTREIDWSSLPATAPQPVVRLLRRCLTRDSRERLRDIGEARVALRSPSDEPAPAEPVMMPAPLWRRLLWPAAALLVGALAVGLYPGGRASDPTPAGSTRFRLQLPEGALALSPEMALSPDGRTAVFRAESLTSSGSELYRRDLEALDAVVIPETAGAESPFFSPDGRSVAFFVRATGAATHELRRVSLDGRPMQAIAELPGLRLSGAWGPDGRIVFSVRGDAQLWQVAAQGGLPEAIPLDAVDGELRVTQVLPDGGTVLGHVGQPGAAEVVLVSVESGDVRRLLPGDFPSYLETGHLLFRRDQALWAVPFDVGNGTTAGRPVPVVQGVDDRGRQGAAFAVSNEGTLVYAEMSTAPVGRLTWVDREEAREPLPIAPGNYLVPRLSPDGRRLAVQQDDEDLWVYDLARGIGEPLVLGGVEDPVWSPDGAWLAYKLTASDGPGIFRSRSDGTGEPERLTSGDHRPESWSSDGDLVFRDIGADFDVSMIRVDDDRVVTPLLASEAIEVQPSVSPDGRWLAAGSNQAGNLLAVFVWPFPDVASGRTRISAGDGDDPVWAADGSALYFLGEDQVYRVARTDGPPETWGPPEPLFEANFFRSGPRSFDLGPDGRFVVIEMVDERAGRLGSYVFVENWATELLELAPVE